MMTPKKLNKKQEEALKALVREYKKHQKIKENVDNNRIIKAIEKVRNNDLIVNPGFDGEYGKVKIFQDNEKIKSSQESLF